MAEKYKHIIWDWNGTILDDVDLCVDVANNLFVTKNVSPLTVEKYKSIFTIPVKDYYVAAGFDFSKESFEVVGKEWMDEYESRKYECNLHSDLIETMEKFQSVGIKQSILSAYKQELLDEMARKLDVKKYVENVVGLDNIYAAGKLHLGQKLMNTLGYNKGETLMIGDTVHDYEVSLEIGADCALISAGHQNYDKLSETGAPVYNSLSELINKIFKNEMENN